MSAGNEPGTPSGLMFGRFQVLEELGAGMQGRVVRAFDTATRAQVALKVLQLPGSKSLIRFKNEFRILAGLTHPNLVRIGELFERDQVWAFSMELIQGDDFLRWVRGGGAGFDEDRLRSGLAQLSSALCALHGAQLVHRDVKPDNVRVTPEGRVVLLDFGLATEGGPSARTASHRQVGTVGYMAPELMLGEVATDKADVYALGALLYETLTGRLPYEGSMFQVATLQRAGPPAPPSSREPSVPADLDALCVALLSYDREKRPTSQAVVALLGGTTEAPQSVRTEARSELFVGRSAELLSLWSVVTRARGQGLRGAVVHGESGLGKTALVAQLTRQVRRELPDAVILSGRCHALEHVSYNAFDDIFDGLATLLVRLPEHERAAILPRDGCLLPALSSSFARVPGISARAVEGWSGSERVHLFDAFAALLQNLGATRTIVLTVDDLQWLDADSAQLFKSLLERGKQLELCLIATARSEALDDHGPALSWLAHPMLSALALSPLDDASAQQLIEQLLHAAPSERRMASLVREAVGSPFFLIELARADPGGPEPATLEEALRSRLSGLPAVARGLLETIAVAGAPIAAGALIDALQLPVEELFGALVMLRRQRCVRETPSGELVTYHDRLREAVVEACTAARCQQIHAQLARTFESNGFRNARRAAQHCLWAGDERRAAPLLEEAAARSLETAVFAQAADLYRQRLALRDAPLGESRQRALKVSLADALAASGDCSGSARVLLEVLVGASPDQRRALSLRAAQQLLQAGELEAGMRAAALALDEVGLSWRGSAAGTLLHLALQRLLIRTSDRPLTGLHARSTGLVEQQLDTLLDLIQPLAWSDLLRSMEIGARGLLLALRERRPDYLPRLLAAEAVQASLRDPGSDRGAQLLVAAAGWLRNDSASREHAYCKWAAGATAVLKTRYAEAEQALLEAERIYRQECPAEAWMHVNTRGMLLNTWLGLGEHRQFVERGEAWIREARAKGNAYAHAYYAVGGQAAFRHVMADQPEQALREIELVMEPWRSSWGVHHLLRVKSQHDVLSYMGGDQAYRWWRDGVRVGPFAPGFFSEGFAWRRADATLRAGLFHHDEKLVREADRLLRPLLRASTPYVRAFAGLSALQIALVEERYADGRRMARTIAGSVTAQDDFRTHSFGLLSQALAAGKQPDRDHWQPIQSWLEQRGWTHPERALGWILPVSALK